MINVVAAAGTAINLPMYVVSKYPRRKVNRVSGCWLHSLTARGYAISVS